MTTLTSKTTKHTPGPWTIRRFGKGSFDVVGPTASRVKRTLTDLMRDEGEREANARLIAAAPEMYELIRMLANDAPMTATPYVMASTLLAKIDGERP